MPENRDDKNEQPREGQQDRPVGAGTGRGRGEDPLAELARLIDEDPFADFDRTRQARAEDEPDGFDDDIMPAAAHGLHDDPVASDDDAAEGGTWHAAPVLEDPPDVAAEREEHAPGSVLPDEPAPYRDDDANRAGLGPDYTLQAGGEEQTGGRADPLDEEDDWFAPSPPPSHPDFDPAVALEAELFAGDFDKRERGDAAAEETTAADPSDNWPETHRQTAAPDELENFDLAPAPPAGGHQHPEPAAQVWESVGDGSWEQDHARRHDDRGYAPVSAQAATLGAPPPDAYPEDLLIEPRSRRGLAVVGSLVALVVLGGAVALGYRGLVGEPTGEPPVIRADTSPTKVAAEVEDAAETETQGKLVYERIGGTQTEREERVVSREEPVFEVAGRDQPVVREVETTPGAQPRPGAEAETVEFSTAPRDEPRRVRTVVVRPDGTIVSPPEPAAASRETPDVPAAEPQLRAAASPSESPEAEAEPDAEVEALADAASEETVALAADGEPTQDAGEAEIMAPSAPDAAEEAQPQPRPQANAPRSGQPLQLVPEAGTTGVTAPTQTAAAPASEPAAVTAEPFASGSYIVQVASTRSEEEARGAASTIAERHSGVLGDYQTAVERADLGDRGIFYRIGVGPLASQSDANALCDQLKATGQECFVRRN